MTCKHVKVSCIDSRPKGPVQSFPYRRYRRLKCLECGERFNTYEITVDQLEHSNDTWHWQFTRLAERIKQLASEL